MELTIQEKALLGKEVVVTKTAIYPPGFPDLPKGSMGKIVDFGSDSGDPIIEVQGETFIVTWDHVVMIHRSPESQ